MKAKDISGQAPGGKRTRLEEVLPLDTPYVVQIFPMYACNFKCNYCIFQTDKSERGFISDSTMMNFNLYKKCVDEMSSFPNKIKVLRFVGIGEPLLHKRITDMVQYTHFKNIANKLEILTNGYFLNPRLSDSLINAGLSRLVVSLQGTTKEKYKEVCGVDINFENFVENLKYFYNKKTKDTDVYIKIVDTALANENDKKRFYDIFGDICDTLAIEHVVPLHASVDYDKVAKEGSNSLTQFGLPSADVKICPQSFFHMQINPDGKVVPCYSFDYPGIMGNCNKESVYDIWNGKVFQDFRLKMLNGKKTVSEVCANCTMINHRFFPEEDLSNSAERLKRLYGIGSK